MKSSETTIISIQEVKREARALYRGRYGAAVKINLIPIIMSIIGVISTVTMLYITVTEIRDMSQMGTVAATSSSSIEPMENILSAIYSVLISAVQLILLWTASWAIIDWFEKPLEVPNFKVTYQVFYRGNFWHTAILAIVQSVLTFLWTLLFILPGVIKVFSYSQTYFAYKIDVENGTRQRQLTDYIKISRHIMDGRKWELFLLELSFIGWHILALLTAGLAYIYVIPYLNASRVAYSRHLFTLAVSEKQAA